MTCEAKAQQANKRWHPSTQAKHVASTTCRALLVVDSSRIRRKALTDCKRARTTFDKAEQELALYEERDRLGFVRWYRMALGPRIAELKEVDGQIRHLREHMFRLAEFVSLKGCHSWEAARMYDEWPDQYENMERKLYERSIRKEEEHRRQMEQERQQLIEDNLRAMRVFLQTRYKQIHRLLKRGAEPIAIFDELLYSFAIESGYNPFSCVLAMSEPAGEELLEECGLEGALHSEGKPEFG